MSVTTRSTLAIFLVLAASAVARAQPTLASITPPTAAAGTATLTITVFGTGFSDDNLVIPGSTVRWNGTTSLSTTYVSPFLLRATIPYTLIANPGTAQLTVFNGSFASQPGTSNALPFVIGAPLQVGISHLNPTSVAAGSGTTSIFVYGNGFQPGGGIPPIPASVVRWNGVPLTTTYISLTLGSAWLRAAVPASLLSCGGTAQVQVENPTPIPPFGTSAFSNIVDFTIVPAISNPTITSVAPTSAIAGGPSLAITVNGCNFAISYTVIGPVTVPNYPKVLLDGTVLATSFVSSTQLTASVPASALATARTGQLQVRNMLSAFAGVDSPAVAFGILAPVIASLLPTSIPVMTPNSPPVLLTVTGSRFLSGATIFADGAPLTTTLVSASELRAAISPALIQTLRPGAIAINVANGTEAVSNTVAFVLGSGANRGTVRRHPLAPLPGAAYSALVEGGFAGGIVTLIADVSNPTPITNWPTAQINLVLAAGTPGATIPIVDGFGLFAPASGATLDATGSLSVPGFVLPNPAVGIAVTVQAVYLDPTTPLGFTLTWPRFPDLL